MPTVKRKDALSAAYWATKKNIDEMPTQLLPLEQTLFRSFNPGSAYTLVPKPQPGRHVSKHQANKLLVPADGQEERNNRFSGPSYDREIPAAAGLYCVLQQQALINEAMHYSGQGRAAALNGRCILRMKLMGAIMVADLSPHNPGAMRFLEKVGADTWDRMVDPEDCSVARGIGLAIAHSQFLRGLSVQTVRVSERSSQERGDNLVLFTSPGRAVTGLYIDTAYYFGAGPAAEIFTVAFP